MYLLFTFKVRDFFTHFKHISMVAIKTLTQYNFFIRLIRTSAFGIPVLLQVWKSHLCPHKVIFFYFFSLIALLSLQMFIQFADERGFCLFIILKLFLFYLSSKDIRGNG